MAEEGNGIPGSGARLSLALGLAGEDDTVHGTSQETVGPIAEEIADIYQNGRGRVRFCAGRTDGDGDPFVFPGEDLQARLARETEEEGNGAVVGMGAGADLGGICDISGADVGVVKETEDAVRFGWRREVGAGEEVRGLDVKPEAEKVEEMKTKGMTLVSESANLGFV